MAARDAGSALLACLQVRIADGVGVRGNVRDADHRADERQPGHERSAGRHRDTEHAECLRALSVDELPGAGDDETRDTGNDASRLAALRQCCGHEGTVAPRARQATVMSFCERCERTRAFARGSETLTRCWLRRVAPVGYIVAMAKVTGIGGVFFKSRNDHKALAAWYEKNLG